MNRKFTTLVPQDPRYDILPHSFHFGALNFIVFFFTFKVVNFVNNSV